MRVLDQDPVQQGGQSAGGEVQEGFQPGIDGLGGHRLDDAPDAEVLERPLQVEDLAGLVQGLGEVWCAAPENGTGRGFWPAGSCTPPQRSAAGSRW